MNPPKKRRGVSRQSAFLASFAITARLSLAAKATRINRDLHYRWMKDDPEYPALFAEAKLKAADMLQDEATRRATDGVFEPNVFKGEFVYPVKGYALDAVTGLPDRDQPIYSKKPLGVMKLSDRLLEFLLRGAKPETYREAPQKIDVQVGPIEIVERLNAARKRVAKPAEEIAA
jgi:hypothetical protein